ncbi:hypothetical protein JI749_01300 [Devosia oryziradicis]|uniref:RiboL-PSP-HEPN domain-containing protein n=1 Tax=Devosia oryziradicis TaxID=2801335 RepID=A0ABX7BWH8_9HYPH|nr:hypothetical protein [Devosia oryziradicis]QQR36303.1 hypothetical protein JI749_01300 [Devosia oryziradicis]
MNSDDRNRKMRVLLETYATDNIHNDLSNTANYFRQRIESRVNKGEHDGLFLEMTAAITMIAFSLEANVNFVGHYKKVPGFKKLQSLDEKLAALITHLKIEADFEARPFSTVAPLKKIRNALAHGKPRTPPPQKQEVVGTYDEIYAKQRMQTEWEKAINPEFVVVADDDVGSIWKLLLEKAEIEIWDTLSTSGGGMTFIEFVEEDGTGE